MINAISPELQSLIDQQIATGRYSSPEEVLREALEALRDRDEDIVAIQAGIADMQAGHMRPASDVFYDLSARLRNAGA